MAAHDKIRLTGRLREGPREGPFLLAPRFARPTIVHFSVRGQYMGLVWTRLGEKAGTRGLMPSATRKRTKTAGDAYCPHCHLLIERKVGDDWPEEPQRCPHCRLLVGAGRARPTPSAEPGARGSAAGVFAHEAKRSGRRRAHATKEDVCKAIRDVAEAVGLAARAPPDGRLPAARLRRRAACPSLSDVFAAYGSWKRARRAAANAA